MLHEWLELIQDSFLGCLTVFQELSDRFERVCPRHYYHGLSASLDQYTWALFQHCAYGFNACVFLDFSQRAPIVFRTFAFAKFDCRFRTMPCSVMVPTTLFPSCTGNCETALRIIISLAFKTLSPDLGQITIPWNSRESKSIFFVRIFGQLGAFQRR